MKIERHLCDLCGGAIHKKDGYALLEVPDFAAIDKAASGAPEPKPDEGQFLFTLRWIGESMGNGGKKYDVCRGCCEGLLKARGYIKRAALERMYAQQEQEA